MAFRMKNLSDCVRRMEEMKFHNKIQHLASRQKPLKVDVLFVSLLKVLKPNENEGSWLLIGCSQQLTEAS